MKFATLALLGVASAKRSAVERAAASNVRAHYPASTVEGVETIGEEMWATLQEAEAAMRAEHPGWTEARAQAFLERQWARYGADLEAWDASPSVRAAESHERNEVAQSAEFRALMADGRRLYGQAMSGRFDLGWRENADGSYDEWISNQSARQIFEELYQVARDFATLARSPVAQRQRALDELTLSDPAAQRIFQRLQNDLNIHSWDALEQRLTQLGQRVEAELRGCPFAARLQGQLRRLRTLVDSTRVVTDMGSDEEWATWWTNGHFENPFAGFSADDLLL